MSVQTRSQRNGSRRANPCPRGAFETLEARLALTADLGFAGVFQTVGGPTTAIYSSSGHNDNLGGGMVTDGAGNRYVTINGTFDHIIDLDPGPAVQAVTTDASLVKLDPNGAVVWTAALNAVGPAVAPVVRINHAVDADQNVYLVGDFRGTVDFDPGPGVMNVASTAGGTDYAFYVAKLNSAGQLQWVRTLAANKLTPDRVAVDGAGNLVIASNSYATTSDPPLDVDAGPGQTFVQQVGTTSLVLLKYTPNGDFLWTRQIGGSGAAATSLNIAADSQGDVYVTGRYTGTVDLDPGAGVYTTTNNQSTFDAFITRLNSNGDFVWAGATEGAGSASFRDIEIVGDGSILVAGGLTGPITVRTSSESLPMTSVLDVGNAFVLKLNSDSSINWTRQFGGYTTMETSLDQEGNIYLGGTFGAPGQVAATYDFDPGPGVYELVAPSTNQTAYVLSLTSAGDFRWAVPLGGNTGRSQVQGLSVTPNGDVQISGAFRGTGDFNPSPTAETWLTSSADQSVFVATLTQSVPNPGAPVVDAGTNQTISVVASANLHGTVTDDGLPNPVTTTWSKVSGPGTVTFGNASAIDTSAAFSTSGVYLLKLEATDGQFAAADYVSIVVNPVTATLAATADTYIDGGNKTSNYGASASLIVDGSPDDGALLKWNLSSIPAGSTLQSATLSINVTGTSTDTYEIYELKRNWTELQATWNKAATGTNWQSAGAQGSLDRGSTVLGTITATATGIRNVVLNAAGLAVVQGWVNNPASNFGFILQDYANSTKDDLVFSSKEATVAANRPQLQLVYNPPGVTPLARASSMSLQTQVAAATASTTVAVKQEKSPVAMSRIHSAPGNQDLLGAILLVHSASETAKHLAATTLFDKDDHDAQERHAACIDVVLGTLGDQLLSKFAFLDR